MTSTRQLNHWMRKDPTYLAAYSLNSLPHLPPSVIGYGLIVNTHPSNLQGQHWIAVRVIHDQAWVFDPLAYPTPPELCRHLLTYCHVNNIHTTSKYHILRATLCLFLIYI